MAYTDNQANAPLSSDDWHELLADIPREMANVKGKGHGDSVAKGDGTTDDRAAINSAILTGKDVFFPDGTYIIASNLTLPSGQDFIFSGNAKIKGETGGEQIAISGGIKASPHVCFDNLTVTGTPETDFINSAWFSTGATAATNDTDGATANTQDFQHDSFDHVTAITQDGSQTGYSGIMKNIVDVQDFGAWNDGTHATETTAAIQDAIDAAGNGGTIFFPGGTYLLNIDVDKRVNIIGSSANRPVLKSGTPDGDAITISSSSWDYIEFSNLTIAGESVTVTRNGVSFGHETYQTDDEFAGRVIFRNVWFENLNIAVYKRYGNIGNKFTQCAFGTCNFHVYAKSEPGITMHAGLDLFENCHFRFAQKASYYLNSTGNGTGVTFFRCTTEDNPGFAFFIKKASKIRLPALTLENQWLENNATAGSVTIDGTSYTPRDIYLNNAVMITRNIDLREVELTNSILYCEFASTGDADFNLTKDSDSAIIENGIIADRVTPTNTDGFAQNIIYMSRGAGGYSSPFIGEPRRSLTNSYEDNLIQASDFASQDIYSWTGTVTVHSSSVNDGILFDRCAEITIADGYKEHYGSFSVTNDKWVIYTVDLKRTTAAQADWRFTGSTAFSGFFHLPQQNRWYTLVGLVNTKAWAAPESPLYLQVDNETGSPATYRVSAFQILEFDKLQDAVEYLQNGFYHYNGKRSFYGDTAPTTGTWSQGDAVWNTGASSDSNIGWVCTSGGTPGTWIPFGLTQLSNAYTTSNVTTDRTIDADATTIDEVADVLSTLIEDLKGANVLT